MDAAVIVVGAGPTGLMLAGELRLAGADVIVLERCEGPAGQSRGLGFTSRTMEIFDQRGLLPRFGPMVTGDTGHFAGIPLDFGVLGAVHRAAKTVPQSQTEAVLTDRALELGADLRRGAEVTDVVAGDEEVEVVVRDAAGTGRLRAAYVVGTDGGRSTVRRSVGFAFPGTGSTREMMLADVRGIDVAPRMTGERLPGGTVMAAPLPDGTTRLVVIEHGTHPGDRAAPLTYDDVVTAWKRLTGEDISHGEPVWLSAFGDAARQVTRYAKGRVLLAGDAAHIHLAAGGQGMNVGVQDALNLGWKLAAVTRGHCPATLLDSYHDERHPVGERVLLNTRAQGHLILGDDAVQPLWNVLAELTRYPDVQRHLAAMVSGSEIRYDLAAGSHPLLGRRLPHWETTTANGATSTTALLRTGRGLLLDLAGSAVLGARAAAWTHRVDLVTAVGPTTGEAAGATSAVLVRPDGHVAWAAPGTHQGLTWALERWFGPPRAGRNK
ncbi:FAD-dependent monooxygenase [Streptomyces sp. NPDC087425]|uniref:FAD-dependent monooxygenase n=1 Tax=Streptomyces sp. NPDC087425 TaxID=3365787 RepID=UPI00380E0099